jgi:hypothetical protein
MSDCQRLIDNIRGILASSGSMPEDVVSTAATELSAACESANDRLRRCGELLRSGLRSEAIQQCEMEPNLLNLVATLDFPELPEWNSCLQSQGFLAQEPLLMDVAAELNEAYALEQPLAALLRRHRLLALARGPLRDRVSTLRKLARLDGNNAVWQDDLRQYERARQQEIRQSAELFSKRGDVAALEEVCQDIQQTDWLEKPPRTLVDQLTSSYARLVRQRARTDLEQLEPQLIGAFSEFDVNQGRVLREQWNACVALAGLSTDEPLLQQTAPALEWLDEQDRIDQNETGFKQAIVELEQALDDGTGLLALDRTAHAALRFDRSLPAVLEQRLRTRMASLELERSRRIRLIAAGAGLVVVLVGLMIGYAVYSHRQAEQIAANVTTLQSLMDKKMFAEAEKLLDQLEASPAIATAPEIQQARGELAKLKQEEQTRQANFTHAIEAAEAAGSDNPDRTSQGEARRLAALDVEKARVVRLDGAIAAAERQRKKQTDDRFIVRLQELTARAAGLNDKHIEETTLASLRQDFNSLMRQSQDVTESVRARGKGLEAQLAGLQKTLKLRHDMGDSLASVTHSLGEPDGFARALDAYAAMFPETTRAIDFKRVSAEASAWKTIEAWNQSLAAWTLKDISHLNELGAKELLATSKKLLAENGDYPLATVLQERQSYLEAVVRRGENGALSSSLHAFFTDPLVSGLWMVEVLDQKKQIARYYLARSPGEQNSGDEVSLNYIVDFSRASTRRKPIRWDSITFNGPAPQSKLAKLAMDELAKLGEQAWEPTFFKIVQSTVKEDRLEPILKVLFLQKILAVACDGSEVMKTSFARYQSILNTVPIESSVPWMDPGNQDARTARESAIALLGRLPDIHSVGEETAKLLKALKLPLGDRHQWIGWLARNDNAEWACLGKASPTSGGKIFLAVPKAGEKAFHWAEVGQLKNGEFKLDPLSASIFVEGRPVYLAE